MFLVGLRFDFLTFSYILGLIFFALIIFPRKFCRYPFSYLLSTIVGLLTFVEMISFTFIAQFGNRPDRMFHEYLKYPDEVIKMVWGGFKLEAVLAIVVSLLMAKYFLVVYRLIETVRPRTTLIKKILVGFFTVVMLAIGARSSLGHRPANISSASFSHDHLLNQLALNSTYSIIYDLYRKKHEKSPVSIYPPMAKDLAWEIVKKESAVDRKIFLNNAESKILNYYQRPLWAAPESLRPKNIIIILEESLGSEFVGRQGGLGVTPFIDKISTEGIFFDALYATGTRTVRGIEATISGFLPTPGSSVVKLPASKGNFFTIASHLKKLNYENYFFYGGDANFDEMKLFFQTNGFDHIIDDKKIDHQLTRGAWGIHDDDLFDAGIEQLRKRNKSRPFLAVFLTTTNHAPFDFDRSKIQIDDRFPPDSHPNAVKFADHAIGYFF